MTFLWLTSKLHNKFGQKVNILVENKTTVTAITNFNKFRETLTFHIKTSSIPWLWVLLFQSNNDDDPILVYSLSLPPSSTNSQRHLTVSRPERKIVQFFCEHTQKKIDNLWKQPKKLFENKNLRLLGNILWKNCFSIKKFQFTISRGPWHGMAHIEIWPLLSKFKQINQLMSP